MVFAISNTFCDRMFPSQVEKSLQESVLRLQERICFLGQILYFKTWFHCNDKQN